MKKLLFCSLMFAFSLMTCKAQSEVVIKLNAPSAQRGKSVMQALHERRSIKSFSDKELTEQDLSDLLFAANGINRPDVGKRTAPSALNSQDIDVYVLLKQGAYLYNAQLHSLSLISEGDWRSLANDKTLPPCLLILVSDISRYKSGNDAEMVSDMSKIDAGIVSQNISLFCAGVDMATGPRAWMSTNQLRQVLKLTATQTPLLNHPVGYPRSE